MLRVESWTVPPLGVSVVWGGGGGGESHPCMTCPIYVCAGDFALDGISNGTHQIGFLLINSLTLQDSGIYVCRARNHPDISRYSEEAFRVTVLCECVYYVSRI